MYETEFVGELFILDEFVRVCYELERVCKSFGCNSQHITYDLILIHNCVQLRMIFNVTVLGLILAQRLIQVAAWTTS